MRAAIILAAGRSRRFGSRNKLTMKIVGATLLDQAVARAWAAGVQRVVIAGSGFVRVPDARLGMGASLIAGLRALRPIEREVLIFLADMPFASAPRGMRLSAGIDAVRPVWKSMPGHPMLVRTAIARRLATRIDRGLGRIDRMQMVRGAEGNILDIDTPAALAQARRRIAAAGGAFGVGKRGQKCSARPLNGSRPPRR